MIWFYRILFLPVFIVVFPFYLRHMLKRGGYGKDFSHRLGGIPALPPKKKGVPRIWIQAVSVGEIQAVEPIVKHFFEQKAEVVLTTTTSTAYKILNEKYLPYLTLGGIFPFDFWLFSRRSWKHINPDLVVLMEGELWPEHLTQAQQRKVPVVLLNGRLSDRSFQRYGKHPRFARWLFKKLDCVLASTPEDADRFAKVGVPAERIAMTGSLKFDVSCEPRLDLNALREARRSLGFGDRLDTRVLIGASTWPVEEELLLNVFQRLVKHAGVDWRLLLVPRHAERREEIVKLLEAQPESWLMRSRERAPQKEVRIALADTTGELRTLVQASDLAFIGKSLPPNDGGQTPIEAAVFGVPMVYGPNMTNFRPICASLEKAKASVRAADAEEVACELFRLAGDTAARKALAQASETWHTANRGAAKRSIERIEELLAKVRG